MKKYDVYYGDVKLNDAPLTARIDAEDFIESWIAEFWMDHPTRSDEYEIRER